MLGANDCFKSGHKKNLEIDCCPNCYSVWLDKGEGADLHLAFLTFEAEQMSEAKAKKISDLQYQVGKEIIEIDNRIERYKKIAEIGEVLSKRLPWYRF